MQKIFCHRAVQPHSHYLTGTEADTTRASKPNLDGDAVLYLYLYSVCDGGGNGITPSDEVSSPCQQI